MPQTVLWKRSTSGRDQFSIIKVLAPSDLPRPRPLEHRLLQFERYYEEIATPSTGSFTRHDLRDVLQRIPIIRASAPGVCVKQYVSEFSGQVLSAGYRGFSARLARTAQRNRRSKEMQKPTPMHTISSIMEIKKALSPAHDSRESKVLTCEKPPAQKLNPMNTMSPTTVQPDLGCSATVFSYASITVFHIRYSPASSRIIRQYDVERRFSGHFGEESC